jgi:3-(3-hydroxy-phenyl)propionate hydroxylase
MAERFDVVVVGFGPAGASCAGLLGSMGVRTLVIDRARSVYDKPRAFALDHEIMRVFQNLGIVDKVLPHTAPFTPSEYYGVDGRLIKRLGAVPPPYPLGWPPNVVFTQPPVEQIMRSAAAAHDSVQLSLGTELIGLEQDASGVRLRLRGDEGGADGGVDGGAEGGPAGAVAKAFEVSARYVIGCDGAASTVRGLLDMPLEDLGFDEPWLVVDVQVNESGLAKLPDVSIQYCEPARPSTYLIGPGNHRRWEIMLLPGEDPRSMESETAIWKLLSRWLKPDEASLWRVASYRFHALVARDWRRGRVFIAGDAAHQQPPFTGQGMCQGVRDVANLSWKLQRVLSGKSGDALLDSYQAERATHVRRLTTLIKNIGLLICERDPVAAKQRDARLLEEAGGEIKTVARQDLIPPLAGAACLLSPLAHAANGTIFPQPRVMRAGAPVLMDELAGSGFRVVVKDRQLVAALCANVRVARMLTRIGARIVLLGADVDVDAATDVTGGGVLCINEADGVLGRWFSLHACLAAIVRPDHYVYGVAAGAEQLDAQLSLLDAAMK